MHIDLHTSYPKYGRDLNEHHKEKGRSRNSMKVNNSARSSSSRSIKASRPIFVIISETMEIVILAADAGLIIFQFGIATEIKGIVDMEENVNLAMTTGILIII